MAITLTCSCGKVLRGPDSFAGLDVTCPVCGAVSTMPAAGASDSHPDPATIEPSYELDSDPFAAATDPDTRPAVAVPPTVRPRVADAPTAQLDTSVATELRVRRMARGGMLVLSLLITIAIGWIIWAIIASASASGGGAAAPPSKGYLTLLAEARKKGQGAVAASNMHQIMLALRTYELANGHWPDSLDDLVRENPAMSGVMVNPRTSETPGFIYVKPKPGAPADSPVLFESLGGKPDPEGVVGRVDGSIGQATASTQ